MAGLLDFFQSASNAAAGNLSAPVDGINWLLKKAGVPVSNAPYGGSDWMAQQGLTKPVVQSAASLAGETMGLLAPVAAAAKAPQIARGLLQMGENAAIPQTLDNQAGMALFDTKGLPYQGRELIQSNAENLAGKLRDAGFTVDAQHSGSLAGPSSYLKVFDPQTGRYFDDVRLSGHSKGAFNSQAVTNVATPEEMQGVIDRALGMRNLGPSTGYAQSLAPDGLDVLAAKARGVNFEAFKAARDSGADFTRYKAKP